MSIKIKSKALYPYLNSNLPLIMASEMKALDDPEYMMRPDPCSGRISKMAANTSVLVENIKFQRKSMYELWIEAIEAPWK